MVPFFAGFVNRFTANKSVTNFFSVLDASSDWLLVGGRNVAMNLSLPYLVEDKAKVRSNRSSNFSLCWETTAWNPREN